MSRPPLRLVQPLDNSANFVGFKVDENAENKIEDIDVVYSHLQLFLLWPDYSSACAKVSEKLTEVKISFDTALSELDQLFLSVDPDTFAVITSDRAAITKLFLEVFGITFSFSLKVSDVAENYSANEPNIAVEIPSSITRHTMRGSRRIRLNQPHGIELTYESSVFKGQILSVSPGAFELALIDYPAVSLGKVSVKVGETYFDAMAGHGAANSLLIKPILSEPTQFGAYFDTYCRFAFPSLRPRDSFEKDPIPELLTKTGQLKKHATREVSDSWLDEIGAAYSASRDARHINTADYVAVDSNNQPIGTSSLARAYLDPEGRDCWAFHGVGVVPDPSLLDQTCMLYLWRADYILSRVPKSSIVVWFDGRGKWLEKVYTKFQRSTPELTRLSAIRHNRYVRNDGQSSTANGPESQEANSWKWSATWESGQFQRTVASDGGISIGLGVPYLNYSGILNNVFYWQLGPLNKEQISLIYSTVASHKPERIFIETPVEHEDISLPGYDHFWLDATNRQCLTSGEALQFFSSSLEHSKAVVKKKYGAR